MKKCIAVVEVIPEERRQTMSMKKTREIIKKREKGQTHRYTTVVDAKEDIDITTSFFIQMNREVI